MREKLSQGGNILLPQKFHPQPPSPQERGVNLPFAIRVPGIEKRFDVWRGVIFLALLLVMGVPVAGQDEPLAALLEVVYGGVEVRRAETEVWLPLQVGAVMPTGDGDTYRTDETGRALITLPEADGELLVLPNSEFTLANYVDPGANGPLVNTHLERGEVVGRVVGATGLRLDSPGGFNDMQVDVFPAHFAVAQFAEARVIVVWRGEYTVTNLGELQAEEVRYDILPGNFTADAPLPHPSPASVVGLADGCPATITTTNGRDLNARTGPSTNNLLLGQFPDGADVRVMGIVAAGGWIRVQFRSGFGWVERLAVELDDPDCALPILPDDSFDLPRIIYDPTVRELDLLEPFYGNRRYDPIFYRSLPTG